MITDPTRHERRLKILQEMRSPPSILLGVVALGVVTMATFFYDRPVTSSPTVLSYFRALAG